MKDMTPIEKDLFAFSVDLFKWLEILTGDGMFYAHPKADFNKIYETFKELQRIRRDLYDAFGIDGEKYKEYKGETIYDENHNMICGPSLSLLENYIDEFRSERIEHLSGRLEELR